MKTLLLACSLLAMGGARADVQDDIRTWSLLFLSSNAKPVLDEIGVSGDRQAEFADYVVESKKAVDDAGRQAISAICESPRSADAVADTVARGIAAVNQKISERVAGLKEFFSPTELSALQGEAAESAGAISIGSPADMIRDGRVNYEGVIERSCPAK